MVLSIYFQFNSCQKRTKRQINCDSNSFIFSGLESLTLTECNIRTFSGQIFSHSPNVRHLLLSHNGLRNLFLDGRNLPRLENLDVKFNRLDDSFFLNHGLKFHQLKTLNISHNRVKNLSHVFKLLSLSPSLANIDIRKMSQIPLKHKIFFVPFIMIFYNRVIHEFCDILLPSHNLIASLPKDLNSTMRRSLPEKVLMNIAGNSLPCDCNLSLVKLKLVSSSKANVPGISFLDFNVKVQISNVIKLKTIYL